MKYYIIAGEASGDLHGSNLIREILLKDPNAQIRAWGGDRMINAGATVVKHIRELAFMGFIEVLQNIITIQKNFSFCKKDILEFNPDVLVCIDYPGFNLRMCKWAKAHGFKTVLYIAPQAWAWKEKRAYTLPHICDDVISILPFEREFFKKFNLHVKYVGHPLADEIQHFNQNYKGPNLRFDKPIIALLPGSRKHEIKSMLPTFLKVIEHFPQYQFIVAGAPAIDEKVFRENGLPLSIPILFNQTYTILKEAKAAIVTSGTATLETALLNTPQMICYKGNPISYEIVKRLIKVPYVSLVNLILQKDLVKEFLQYDLTVKNLEAELNKILTDSAYQENILKGYKELQEIVGTGGASAKAADIVIARAKA